MLWIVIGLLLIVTVIWFYRWFDRETDKELEKRSSKVRYEKLAEDDPRRAWSPDSARFQSFNEVPWFSGGRKKKKKVKVLREMNNQNYMMERFDFLGVNFNATNQEEARHYFETYDYNRVGYVSFPDSSVVALSQKEPEIREILNNSLLTLPDGKPSQMAARSKGFRNVTTVSGYWLCRALLQSDKTHYFLGSTPEKLTLIKENISREFPEAMVLGYQSPAFCPVSYFMEGNLLYQELDEINTLQPDIIWIGLSSPKQDYLMRTHVKQLRHGVMFGVGGVFDYLSGEVEKSPEWIKQIGLRWLWRLLKEPKRLGPKYWNTLKVLFRVIVLRKGQP